MLDFVNKMSVLNCGIWVLFLLLKPVISQVEKKPPALVVVECSQGVIIGRLQEETEMTFYAFKGIPYAEPPVGELRFKDPVRIVQWRDMRSGEWDPPRCPQLKGNYFIGNENCLYLNVFTPKVVSASFPVMVFIHGGEFSTGGADDYSPLPLLSQDIVLVILQYRLGVLGFLSTEDETLPGNLGLKDQTLALRWVKDNIQKFAGDPNSITLFGTGSGAASVHYQILTPYAKGLFTRAILQSGSSLSPRYLRKHHSFLATELLKKFSCPSLYGPEKINSAELITCLRNVSAQDITTSYPDFLEWHVLPLLNVPRVDGDYLPAHPGMLMKEGRYNKVNLMTGYNKHDGSIITSPLYHYPILVKAFWEGFLNIGSLTMSFDEEAKPAYLAAISFRNYVRGRDIRLAGGANRITKLYTDRLFAVGIVDTLILNANSSLTERLFTYKLAHRGKESSCNDVYTTLDNHWICHGDEVQYLFEGAKGFPPLEHEDDLKLRKIMVTLWTNFATYGNPTPDASLGFTWDAYTRINPQQLELSPLPVMTSLAYDHILQFWHSHPFGMNEYLYPKDFGRIVNLEDEFEEEENLNGAPVFKTALADYEITKVEEPSISFANAYFNKKKPIDPTDELGRMEMEAKDPEIEARSMSIDDLTAGAGIWNKNILPKGEWSRKVCAKTPEMNIDDLTAGAGIWNKNILPKGELRSLKVLPKTPERSIDDLTAGAGFWSEDLLPKGEQRSQKVHTKIPDFNTDDLMAASGFWSEDLLPKGKQRSLKESAKTKSKTANEKEVSHWNSVYENAQSRWNSMQDTTEPNSCEKPDNPDSKPESKIKNKECKIKTKDKDVQKEDTFKINKQYMKAMKHKYTELNIYNLIKSGFVVTKLGLKVINKAGETEEVLTEVRQDNLDEIIKTYGQHVKQMLESVKVSEEQFDEMAKQREVLEKHDERLKKINRKALEHKKTTEKKLKGTVGQEKPEIASDEKFPNRRTEKKTTAETIHTETVILEKPEITIDKKYPNKRKINYGNVDNLIQEPPKKITPHLDPSGDN